MQEKKVNRLWHACKVHIIVVQPSKGIFLLIREKINCIKSRESENLFLSHLRASLKKHYNAIKVIYYNQRSRESACLFFASFDDKFALIKLNSCSAYHLVECEHVVVVIEKLHAT
jgi:hypothetical protein